MHHAIAIATRLPIEGHTSHDDYVESRGATMQSRVVFVVWMAICVLASPRAHGQPVDALKKAQAAFDQAQLDYLQGKYDESARGFQDAYVLRPVPQFLYNVGASFHMKGKKASD